MTETSRHEHTHSHRAPGSAARPAGTGRRRRPTTPFPGVEQVRPGLWSIPVPIPNNPLRYVLVYAFETDRGPYLVDAGSNTDDAYAALSPAWPTPNCQLSATSRACWSPTSTLTTTAWPGGSGDRPGPGSPYTRPTPPSSAAARRPDDLMGRVGDMLAPPRRPAEEIAAPQ